ncbi:MAG: hypothetical protein WBV39_06685 [Rudaea sp.]
MRALFIQLAILSAGSIFSASAMAGVGATNSGVTTTLPQDPTQPSADVQSQSSGFVQQNQQLANQQSQARARQTGIVLPNGTVQSGSQSRAAASANPANPNGAESGKNGAPDAAAQTPPPPPAPPPVYQSVIKPVVRDTSPAGDDVADMAVASTTAAPAAIPPPPPVRAKPHPVHDAITPRRTAPARTAAKHSAVASSKPAPIAAANTGGRGSAPDGYTFMLGLLATGVLLAFALVTYLRLGRSGSNNADS